MRFIFFVSLLFLFCCKSENPSNISNNQGIFEFPEELDFTTSDKIPDYMEADMVLCNGRGLRVAKCISDQLKKGMCLGIIKEGKDVYVIEIDCEEVKKAPVDSSDVIDI